MAARGTGGGGAAAGDAGFRETAVPGESSRPEAKARDAHARGGRAAENMDGIDDDRKRETPEPGILTGDDEFSDLQGLYTPLKVLGEGTYAVRLTLCVHLVHGGTRWKSKDR